MEAVDYGPYLDSDTWPSESKGDVWVGDLPPQHAASALAKLMRWAREQPALDEGQEIENEHTVRASRLCQFLEAQATSKRNFVFDGVTANGVIAATHDEVPYSDQLRVYATAVSNIMRMDPGDLVRHVVQLHAEIDHLGFTLIQKEI